jgi:deoxyribonuclease V
VWIEFIVHRIGFAVDWIAVKIPRPPHAWNLSPARAAEVQRRLSTRVRVEAPRGPLRRVAGVDCAYAEARWRQPAPMGSDCIAAAVVWDVASGRVVEQRIARRPLHFPYVPGLLSFRELPAMLAALRALKTPVDAVLTDGHGLAHPRRFGIGCHLGVLCDLPTAGVAKSVLVGEYEEPGVRRGARRALYDDDERIGTALRTRDATKPVFVSIGHRIDLPSAERLVLACGAGYRLPEPTRLADRAVAEAKHA